jgi:hypothetical protein
MHATSPIWQVRYRASPLPSAPPPMTLTPRLALLLTLPPLLWAGNAVVGRLVRDDIPPMALNACWPTRARRWRAGAAWPGSASSAWAATTRCNTWHCTPRRR